MKLFNSSKGDFYRFNIRTKELTPFKAIKKVDYMWLSKKSLCVNIDETVPSPEFSV